MKLKFDIDIPDASIKKGLKEKIDGKTKPVGSLGRLEEVAMQIGTIQQTLYPELKHPTIVVFAADHGIAGEGVSAYLQEVTRQMVINFVKGGAAINIFAGQNGIHLKIVDAGVMRAFESSIRDQLIDYKIGEGTKSFLEGPAMREEQCEQAIEKGRECVQNLHQNGVNVVGFGEMGIGNTSSSALLMHLLTGFPLETCIGRGTGLDDEGLQRKTEILTRSLSHYKSSDSEVEILARYGGFETAMMTGAFLQAAENKMTILVDGFNTTVALLLAYKLYPAILDYCIFSHQSGEKGHAKLLEYLGAMPLLNMDMRLGEGTGVAVSYPIIRSAVNFLNDMASFENAEVLNSKIKM